MPYKEARVLKNKECYNIYGGNMFFRKDILQTTGGFDPRFGMEGKKIAYSEETVLLRAIRKKMPEEKMYYDPRLYIYHLVRPTKMILRCNLKSVFAHGRYSYYYSDIRSGQGAQLIGRPQLLKRLIRSVKALAVNIISGFFWRDRKRYPYIQNYLYDIENEFLDKEYQECLDDNNE